MALSAWISRISRQGGEYNSPTVAIPAGITEVHIVLYLVDINDFSNPALAISARVEVSMDGAASWQVVGECGWIGGTFPAPPPGKSSDLEMRISGIENYVGGLARAHISSSGTFRWGIRGEIIRGN